ncbi:MAG: DNA-deoxyinosine glycosylase [Spirochaetes bacterium]|nr:MAG: DNA-deoxyinosine glycosylase [Spirochaetota bacterium]
MIRSFPPIADSSSRILILGSMPGVMSLDKKEYYGNPANKFWKIMFAVFGAPGSDNYRDKLRLLKNNAVALWDVLESCEREGSLDSEIRNERPNDIGALVKKYPGIRCLLFNGKSVAKLFKKHHGADTLPGLEARILPSTSPAHAVSFEVKYAEWKRVIGECLGG